MEKSIGALWEKISTKGNKFWSGNVEIDGVKTPIVAFQNTRKLKETHPDINIFLAKKLEQKVGVILEAPAEDPMPEEEEINPKDIPF
jgi:hypothetical protein